NIIKIRKRNLLTQADFKTDFHKKTLPFHQKNVPSKRNASLLIIANIQCCLIPQNFLRQPLHLLLLIPQRKLLWAVGINHNR
ncbi:MAG: hypothetical protein FWG90_05065, partial [Oscillospiraceae bacterium]|nr:hypothetical protein [Oscillospiraceae bacterium]